LLALCSDEELTVGELATLVGESQPQITKKSQPLREAGLLAARRDGTRTLLRTEPTDDVVVLAALAEGRALCTSDGSLARVPRVVAEREESSRRFFADLVHAAQHQRAPAGGDAIQPLLPLLAPLLPGRALAVDLGTGEGALLPLLSPLYERVLAVDASAARLARCAAHIAAVGLTNVRLLECDGDSALVAEEVGRKGGADLVTLARVLHHVARPQGLLTAAARLLKPGAHLALIEHLPHDDERARDRGAVWLGFEPARLVAWVEAAGLLVVHSAPMHGAGAQHEQLLVVRKP
jgi:ArsR family transcriptional regulator